MKFSHSHAQICLLAGRILLGALFFLAGFQKLMGGVGSLSATIDSVTGLPLPGVLAVAVIAVELIGGGLLIIGFHTRKAAVSLVLFTLLTIVFFHPGWSDQSQMTMMMKNLAVIGGLLAYVGAGAGNLSLDSKLRGAASTHNIEDPSPQSMEAN